MGKERKGQDTQGSQDLIEKVKQAVRKWYATVSVKELALNRALVAEIEAFERLLAGKGVTS